MGCLIDLLYHLVSAASGRVSRVSAPKPYVLKTRGRPSFLLVWLVCGWLVHVTLPAIRASHPAMAAAWLTPLFVLLFPWPLARAVTIPLGLIRTSYYLTLLASFTWWRDLPGGAVVAAMLAARRRARQLSTCRDPPKGTLPPRTDGWLRTKLETLHVLRAAGTAASALAGELLDGDRNLAREKMRAVLEFDPRVCPRAADALAKRTLAEDDEPESPVKLGALPAELQKRQLELADAAGALAVRIERQGTRTPEHELTEWCTLRRLYARVAVLSGPETRLQAFSVIEPALRKQAVWMFNVFQQRPLADAMFGWLAAEAEATGHPAEADSGPPLS